MRFWILKDPFRLSQGMTRIETRDKPFCFQFHYWILLKQEYDQKLFQIIQDKCKSNSKFNFYLSTHIIKQGRTNWFRDFYDFGDFKLISRFEISLFPLDKKCDTRYSLRHIDTFYFSVALEINNEFVKYRVAQKSRYRKKIEYLP
jgi:hypothetical protein